MKFFFFSCIILFISLPSKSTETWILDKKLSSIEFELPIFLGNNVKGVFKEIEGLVEIDLNSQNNNKAIFSADINSINMNYKKYKKLLLSNIFFDAKKFPKALVDTKKFSYQNQKLLDLNVELTIKGVTNIVPLSVEIIRLAESLVQIKGEIKFSRTSFNIGIRQWKNTSILKDKAHIIIDLFLFKE